MPHKDPKVHSAYQVAWRRNHPEVGRKYRQRHLESCRKRQRDYDARKRYGVASGEDAKSLRSNPCAICGKVARKMCLDHDGPPREFNGTFRGILCQQCNTRLGWFERYREVIVSYLVKPCQQ